MDTIRTTEDLPTRTLLAALATLEDRASTEAYALAALAADARRAAADAQDRSPVAAAADAASRRLLDASRMLLEAADLLAADLA